MEVDCQASPVLESATAVDVAFKFRCAAGRSIANLPILSQETDTVVVGFDNGKLMQVCIDLVIVK